MDSLKTIDYVGIRTLTRNHGINPDKFVLVDSEYAFPSKTWLLNEFCGSLKSFLNYLGLSDYQKSNNDCDDFCRAAALLAQVLHHRTSPNSDSALAIGEFYYNLDSGAGNHAINIAIIFDSEPKIVFLEPQTREQVFLSEREKNSCYFIRF